LPEVGLHIHVFVETKAPRTFLKELEKLAKQYSVPFDNIKGLKYWLKLEKAFQAEPYKEGDISKQILKR